MFVGGGEVKVEADERQALANDFVRFTSEGPDIFCKRVSEAERGEV